jgi:S-DNA-T family DNA segregation ATPase FtsK/SpoIIIE
VSVEPYRVTLSRPARRALTDRLPADVAMGAANLPARLRDLAADWAPYRRLTGTGLRADLAALGVKVPSTGNKYPVDPVTVRAQKARRDTARAAAEHHPDQD